MELYQSEDGVRESKLTEYVRGVLDALGCRHSPSHAEVMWLDSCDEPCLVEVGCRPHGGEGTFVRQPASESIARDHVAAAASTGLTIQEPRRR